MNDFNWQWLWLLLLIVVGWVALILRKVARADAELLIDSVVKNSLQNLGYKPDAASLTFLARHPFLSARIWKMLGEGGAASGVGGVISEENTAACDRLVHYVYDKKFRERYPCAGALIQYAIYLCDLSPNQEHGCRHPKDERTGVEAPRTREGPHH